VSLNQWIAVAVAQKVGVSEPAAEFFARRAEKANEMDMVASSKMLRMSLRTPRTKYLGKAIKSS